MLHPKFILTRAGYLRIGTVRQHRDLLLHGDRCAGGGYWEIDYVNNALALSGQSYDFGEPQWSAISTLYIPESYRGMAITYEGREVEVVKTKYYDDSFIV